MTKQKIKTWEKEFDEKFCYWVVLGSTLNAGSVLRLKTEMPSEIKQFIKSLLHQERKRVIEECETLINYSEGRASGLECSQAGYEYGVEDVLSIFKKRSKE